MRDHPVARPAAHRCVPGMHTATPRQTQSCTCCCCCPYLKHRLAAANIRDPHGTRECTVPPSIHGHGCRAHTRRKNGLNPRVPRMYVAGLIGMPHTQTKTLAVAHQLCPFYPVTSCSTNSHLCLANAQKAVSHCTPQCCDVFFSSSHHAAADDVRLEDLCCSRSGCMLASAALPRIEQLLIQDSTKGVPPKHLPHTYSLCHTTTWQTCQGAADFASAPLADAVTRKHEGRDFW
jgi:hypothetical protein